ncbi:LLM class flavin-dependent oxidoreductase [Dietzia sp. IN118]|jgi:probable LLM family oxidoreductase|uniref:LLM class flavin-dependent oxidoreductase n=1 Tax=Dietzia sp. IN118 TaxID=3061631 RepID=UPI0029398DEA|nr:LLM class flavin-dependent oxidoreductase [Dietzia sp. IN118]MDV3356856.1 LLM class flavin-dependent oxidoreductase [Dietzia sp. IN118]
MNSPASAPDPATPTSSSSPSTHDATHGDPSTQDVAFGLDTFGDVTVDRGGRPVHHAQVLRDVVEQAVLADQVGVDAFGIGEHHRPDFAVSAPDVLLAGIATRTERITLGSAVTVLSSDDPIRVFQRFATIDALSNGRAEVVLGRGSFTESFPLFGLDLARYEQLFSEKLDLFAALLPEGPVTWSGELRPPLVDQHVYPKTEHGLNAWIAVGGSPESVVRAARYRMPLMLAIIGGPAGRFAPFADLYREANAQFAGAGSAGGGTAGGGAAAPRLPIAVHSPGFVAETDARAAELSARHWLVNRNQIGRERGWGDATEADFHREVRSGAMYVGSPETVAQKIATTVRTLGLDRFDLKYASGPTPHDDLMTSVDLYGRKVIPRVRELLAEAGYTAGVPQTVSRV